MSPLTKAFVVLVTILSVVLVALVVPFVAKTQNYEDQLQQLRSEAQAARAAASLQQRRADTAADQLSTQQAAFATERQGLSQQLQDLDRQLQEARANLASERARMVDLQTSLARLTAGSELDARLVSTLRDELNTARGEMVNVRGQNIELADRAVELQSNLQAAERAVRQLREQMAALQQEAAQYRDAIAMLPPDQRPQLGGQSGEPAPVPAPEVQGNVTAVEAAGGATLVQVDVGSSDGIRPGMRLLVARGQDFVGTLVVEQVDADAAAGRMILQQQAPQQGDAIYGGQFQS